nr:MAG TPA: hypothetical protein [Caudoviricetes sp.]
MTPCVGIEGIAPPLCRWHELTDGTYNLADVERFNQALAELAREYRRRQVEYQR